MNLRSLSAWYVCLASSVGAAVAARAEQSLPFVLPEQGLFVHVGTTDGALEAAWARSGRRLVHGLTLDPPARDVARRALSAAKLYGVATVDSVADFTRLPYAERIVNVLVADLDALGNQAPPEAELQRVVAPLGKCIVRRAGKWSESTQPLPAEMDTWSHWDRGPDGNPVSRDRLVRPPTSLRWQAGPVRGMHDALAGMRLHAGRVFYSSEDEDSPHRGVEARRALYCRDAFNGLLLWKRPVAGLRNRFAFVVDRGQVYTIVEDGGPVEALDVQTGETRVRYVDGTAIPPSQARLDKWRRVAGGLELPLSASHLIVRRYDDNLLQAYEHDLDVFVAASGRKIWSFREGDDKFILWCIVGEGKVFAVISSRPLFPTRGSPSFLVDAIVALDAATGRLLWRQRELAGRVIYRVAYADGHLVIPSFPSADGKSAKGYSQNYAVHKLRADTGAIAWRSPDGLKSSGHYQVTMVKEGQVFVGNQSGFALDFQTGRPLYEKFNWAQYDAGCADLRGCPGYTFYGLTFIDDQHRVITRGQARSSCDVGNFPGYGLIYSQPSHCLCSNYVNGHLALAAETPPRPIADSQRLQAGRARTGDLRVDSHGWPMHLANARRGAYVPDPVPAQLQPLWQAAIPTAADSFLAHEWRRNDQHAGPITAPTVAHGRVFVAVPDLHRLDALDATTGKPLWSFTAGGRIDSPPTLVGSLAIFGCRDGCVYALTADQGELVWKFTAALTEKRILVQSQLESAWPVCGSVLWHQGQIVLTAGRQSALDQGIQVYRLDPATGKLLHKTRIWTDPDAADPMLKGYQPIHRRIQDLLVSDGVNVHATIDTLNAADAAAEVVSLAPQTAADRGGWIPKEGGQMPWLWANSNGFVGRSTESQGRWDAAPMVYAQLQGQRFVLGPDRTLYLCKSGLGGLQAWALDAAGKPETLRWETKAPATSPQRKLAALIGAGDRLFVALQAGSTTILQAYARDDGRPLGECSLEHPPLRDGLVAAGGKLYLSTADAQVLCLGDKSE